MVPIFYQRNSRKTRNCIAQSVHAVNFLSESTPSAAALINDSPNPYEDSSVLKQTVFQIGQSNNSRNNNDSNTYAATEVGSNAQKLKARLDQKLIKEARSKYQAFRLGLHKIHDFEKKTVTDQKCLRVIQRNLDLKQLQENEFINIENFELFEEKPIEVSEVPPNREVTVNNYGDPDESEESRKGTPNPYFLHVKRQSVKESAGKLPLLMARSEHA